MNTMHILVAAGSILALSATARAGEGAGDPFPGPNAQVVEPMAANPHYTMGADAPFNYFYAPQPTALNRYHQAQGAMQDPYPFKANGQTIQVAPAPGTAYAHEPQFAPGGHG